MGAVGTGQITPPLPRNQKPGIGPGFLMPASNSFNDRIPPRSGPSSSPICALRQPASAWAALIAAGVQAPMCEGVRRKVSLGFSPNMRR